MRYADAEDEETLIQQPVAAPHFEKEERVDEPGNTLSLRNAPAGSARVLWLDAVSSEERWAIVRLGDAEDVLRFQLLESILRCGSALAKPVVFRDGKWCPVEVTLRYMTRSAWSARTCARANRPRARGATARRRNRCRPGRSGWPSGSRTAASGRWFREHKGGNADAAMMTR